MLSNCCFLHLQPVQTVPIETPVNQTAEGSQRYAGETDTISMVWSVCMHLSTAFAE